jgi:hypothetical protein
MAKASSTVSLSWNKKTIECNLKKPPNIGGFFMYRRAKTT